MKNRIPPEKRKPIKPSGPPTEWDGIAGWYDQLVGDAGSEYHRHVIIPGVLRLLAIRPGETVLDVACGQGVLCRVLHHAGANVTGVDASDKLLRIARQRSELAIEYIRADARDLSSLPAGRYSAATLVLAVQNIHPLPPLFEGVARCLTGRGEGVSPLRIAGILPASNEGILPSRVAGVPPARGVSTAANSAAVAPIASPSPRLVIVMTHPCFRGPKATSWGWDEQAGVQFRRVDRYLLPRKEPIVTHPGSDPTHYTWTFHRPLQAYVKALRGAGFLIDAMEEWPSHKTSEPSRRGAAENAARKEIPMFLALRAVKT